jgi:hypothetical protein
MIPGFGAQRPQPEPPVKQMSYRIDGRTLNPKSLEKHVHMIARHHDVSAQFFSSPTRRGYRLLNMIIDERPGKFSNVVIKVDGPARGAKRAAERMIDTMKRYEKRLHG